MEVEEDEEEEDGEEFDAAVKAISQVLQSGFKRLATKSKPPVPDFLSPMPSNPPHSVSPSSMPPPPPPPPLYATQLSPPTTKQKDMRPAAVVREWSSPDLMKRIQPDAHNNNQPEQHFSKPDTSNLQLGTRWKLSGQETGAIRKQGVDSLAGERSSFRISIGKEKERRVQGNEASVSSEEPKKLEPLNEIIKTNGSIMKAAAKIKAQEKKESKKQKAKSFDQYWPYTLNSSQEARLKKQNMDDTTAVENVNDQEDEYAPERGEEEVGEEEGDDRLPAATKNETSWKPHRYSSGGNVLPPSSSFVSSFIS